MADHIGKAGAVYRDDQGLTSNILFWVKGSGIDADAALADAYANGNDLVGLIDAMTNANTARKVGLIELNTSFDNGFGTDANYESCSQGAEMVFKDAFGGIHRWTVPAPKETLFLSNGITIDSADGAVAAFVAAVLANVVNQSGDAINLFVGGRFRSVQRKAQRIGLKTPSLT